MLVPDVSELLCLILIQVSKIQQIQTQDESQSVAENVIPHIMLSRSLLHCRWNYGLEMNCSSLLRHIASTCLGCLKPVEHLTADCPEHLTLTVEAVGLASY